MNKDKIWNYTIYLIWAFFAFSGIYDLFFFPARSFMWFGELGLALIIYYKIKVPKKVYIGILAILLANLFGELFFRFFYIIPNYDKFIHLLSPLLACTLFYFIFEKKVENKKILILLSITCLLSFELFWEILEYFSDLFLKTNLTGVQLSLFEGSKIIQISSPYQDTIYDMLYNFVGSIIWGIITLFTLKNHKSTYQTS